jgi:hypothetical protein
MVMRRSIGVLTIAAFLAGCSSSGFGSGPRGWKAGNVAGLWVNPRASKETWIAVSGPFSGTLSDLASQETTDVILANKALGARFLSGVPFTRCPGEAGLQLFSLRSAKMVAEVAFAVQGSRQVTVTYQKPTGDPDDPAAIDAMAANVCALP